MQASRAATASQRPCNEDEAACKPWFSLKTDHYVPSLGLPVSGPSLQGRKRDGLAMVTAPEVQF